MKKARRKGEREEKEKKNKPGATKITKNQQQTNTHSARRKSNARRSRVSKSAGLARNFAGSAPPRRARAAAIQIDCPLRCLAGLPRCRCGQWRLANRSLIVHCAL